MHFVFLLRLIAGRKIDDVLATARYNNVRQNTPHQPCREAGGMRRHGAFVFNYKVYW